MTVKVWPPIRMESERAAPRLGSTTKPTVPFPVPLAPEAIVIQAALVVAVHAQLAVVMTSTEPVAPMAVTDVLPADRV